MGVHSDAAALDCSVWQVLKKLDIEWLYDPATPLLRIFLKEMETYVYTNAGTNIFIAALFIMAPE